MVRGRGLQVAVEGHREGTEGKEGIIVLVPAGVGPGVAAGAEAHRSAGGLALILGAPVGAEVEVGACRCVVLRLRRLAVVGTTTATVVEGVEDAVVKVADATVIAIVVTTTVTEIGWTWIEHLPEASSRFGVRLRLRASRGVLVLVLDLRMGVVGGGAVL